MQHDSRKIATQSGTVLTVTEDGTATAVAWRSLVPLTGAIGTGTVGIAASVIGF